jgi:hypothetical protein
MERNLKNQLNGIVGTKAFYGCDIVEICSIIVNGFVNVKMTHPHDKGKIVILHISQIEIL